METRPQFLLLVSSFALAGCSRPWDAIKRAAEIPDNALFAAHRLMALEDMALNFVAFQAGECPRPNWMPLNEGEERYFRHHPQQRPPARSPQTEASTNPDLATGDDRGKTGGPGYRDREG